MADTIDTNATLITTWIFAFMAEALMGLRLFMRRRRKQKFVLSDHLTIAAMASLVVRLALCTVVVVWGTSDLTAEQMKTIVWTDSQLYRHEVGSKMTLAVRVVYNIYAWLQKSVVMLLYYRMFSALPWMDKPLAIYWMVLAATFVVAQVTTFTDCRPFKLYWKVSFPPQTCSEALLQLTVLCVMTIITDFMLIILPMPMLLKVKRSLQEKFQLISLFSIGFVLIAVTIVRLLENFDSNALQVNRTIWASVEAFAAAFVANMPTLYTLRSRPGISQEPGRPRSVDRPVALDSWHGTAEMRSPESDVQFPRSPPPPAPPPVVERDGWKTRLSDEENLVDRDAGSSSYR